MDPKTLLTAFLQIAVKYLPFPFNALGGVLLDVLLSFVTVSGKVGALTFAAPDQLKQWLTDFLTDAAGKIRRPILRRMALMLASMITAPLVDEVWDLLFSGGHMEKAASTFPGHVPAPRTAPAPITINEAELVEESAADLAAA